jgi:quercetin dioxygenase-like cupin family protein
MAAVVHGPGEGDALFRGRIVIKSDLEQLSITESRFDGARPGADSHLHRRHVDSFYVLEGELAFLVRDEEHLVGAGGFVCAPPGVVHGFRSTRTTRFLNFHTPDAGFADNLRARDRGEPGGFDSVDVPRGTGRPASEATLLRAGEGERLEGENRIATIKVGRDELSFVEFGLDRGFGGPEPHAHDDHVNAFYVLEGETQFVVGSETLVLGAGSFLAAPPGVQHTFSAASGPSRVLNVHAPSACFHQWLRESG